MNIKITGTVIKQCRFYIGTEIKQCDIYMGTVIFGGKVFRFEVIFKPEHLRQAVGRPDIRDIEVHKLIHVNIFDPETYDPDEEFKAEIEINRHEEVFLIESIGGFLLNSYYDKTKMEGEFKKDDDTVPELIRKYKPVEVKQYKVG